MRATRETHMRRFNLQFRGEQNGELPSCADQKIVQLPNFHSAMETNEGEVALDLVYQAAEIIRRLETGAAELEERARSAMESAEPRTSPRQAPTAAGAFFDTASSRPAG